MIRLTVERAKHIMESHNVALRPGSYGLLGKDRHCCVLTLMLLGYLDNISETKRHLLRSCLTNSIATYVAEIVGTTSRYANGLEDAFNDPDDFGYWLFSWTSRYQWIGYRDGRRLRRLIKETDNANG